MSRRMLSTHCRVPSAADNNPYQVSVWIIPVFTMMECCECTCHKSGLWRATGVPRVTQKRRRNRPRLLYKTDDSKVWQMKHQRERTPSAKSSKCEPTQVKAPKRETSSGRANLKQKLFDIWFDVYFRVIFVLKTITLRRLNSVPLLWQFSCSFCKPSLVNSPKRTFLWLVLLLSQATWRESATICKASSFRPFCRDLSRRSKNIRFSPNAFHSFTLNNKTE